MPKSTYRRALTGTARLGLAGLATTGVLFSAVATSDAHAAPAAAGTTAEPDAPSSIFQIPPRPPRGADVVDLGDLFDGDHAPRGSVDIEDRVSATSRSQPGSRETAELDARTLSKAMGGTVSMDRYRELLPAFNNALDAANLDNVREVAMFSAQVGHESVGLKYMEEIASGSAYNGRADLGNVHPGDGERFKGRGPIQVTGRANYSKVSEWAHARGMVPTPDYFVKHPAKLASDRYGFDGVVWYWTSARDMNSYANQRDIVGATQAVNGGTNGLSDRISRWRHGLEMGNALLGKK